MLGRVLLIFLDTLGFVAEELVEKSSDALLTILLVRESGLSAGLVVGGASQRQGARKSLLCLL